MKLYLSTTTFVGEEARLGRGGLAGKYVLFTFNIFFRFRLRKLVLIAVNFSGEAEHGRWEARLVYTWACQQSHRVKHSQLWNWIEVGNTFEGSLKMFQGATRQSWTGAGEKMRKVA